MNFKLKLFLVFVLLSGLVGIAQAKINKYTYPYDISEIEWQILNWGADWRGTTTLADPFVLDKIDYDRKDRKVIIYLSGKSEQGTNELLKKSIDGIEEKFKERFPGFEAKSDLIVYYNLRSEKDPKNSYFTYSKGDFSVQESLSKQQPAMPEPTTSY